MEYADSFIQVKHSPDVASLIANLPGCSQKKVQVSDSDYILVLLNHRLVVVKC